MKINLILTSHGHMAEETLKSAEMIVGKVDGASVVQMEYEDGMDGVKEKLKNALDLYEDNPVLIMSDLYGGTPFNVAMILGKPRANTRIIAGFNLGMVIEYFTYEKENLDKLSEHLCKSAREAIRIPDFQDDGDIDLED